MALTEHVSHSPGSRAIDITGQVFGRLTVIERAGTYLSPGGKKTPTWLCRCECGANLTIHGKHLRSGASRSCGCLSREATGVRNTTRSGDAHPRWKGDDIGYKAAHERVTAARGPVSAQRCADCTIPAEEWSYVGGCPRERASSEKRSEGCAYSPNSERYVARCKSCHRRYDAALEAA